MNGIKGIYYREMLVMKSRIFKTLLASSVSPLLFLLAFGYGVGRGAAVDGATYMTFLIPGLVAMSSMNQSYGISTEINISRFYFKVFDEYLLAPIRKWEIVAGEMLYGVTKGFLPVAIIILYGFLAGADYHFSFLFIPAIIMHLLIFSLLGLIVALLVKNHGDQFAVNTFVITPMVFLSGTFYPVEKMPVVIKAIASVFPLTYSTKLIRHSLIGGDIPVLTYMGILLAIFAILFYIAYYVVRRVEV